MSTRIEHDGEMSLSGLKEAMTTQLQKAAEPLIQKAVEEFEQAARKRVGEMCIAIIDKNYSMQRMGTDLVIHVRGLCADKFDTKF